MPVWLQCQLSKNRTQIAVVTCLEQLSSSNLYKLRGKGLVSLIGAVLCLLAENCWFVVVRRRGQRMAGRIVRCGIISS